MKIEITKEEYRLLLDVLSIASHVLTAHKSEDDPRTEPYETLEQKIFSHAKDFGCEDMVLYDEESGQYYPSIEYEEAGSCMEFMDEFVDDSFWEELVSRMAERDLVDEIGEEEFMQMDPMERMEREDVLREEYIDEFEQNGLDNLVIEEE